MVPSPIVRKRAGASRASAAVEYVARMQTGTAVGDRSAIQRCRTCRLHEAGRWQTRRIAIANWTAWNRADSVQSSRAFRSIPRDRARHLYRQGEPHLRSGARRYRQGQQRPVARACSARTSRPITTSWRATSCCLDNFYVNADVSADGHNWATAAIAPDYVQKMWPNSYAGRGKNLRLRRRRAGQLCRPPVTSGPMRPPPA